MSNINQTGLNHGELIRVPENQKEFDKVIDNFKKWLHYLPHTSKEIFKVKLIIQYISQHIQKFET